MFLYKIYDIIYKEIEVIYIKCSINIEGCEPVEVTFNLGRMLALDETDRASALMNNLMRFTADQPTVWGPHSKIKYTIVYNHLTNQLSFAPSDLTQTFGAIYFNTPDQALRAIETFKEELLWYFNQ